MRDIHAFLVEFVSIDSEDRPFLHTFLPKRVLVPIENFKFECLFDDSKETTLERFCWDEQYLGKYPFFWMKYCKGAFATLLSFLSKANNLERMLKRSTTELCYLNRARLLLLSKAFIRRRYTWITKRWRQMKMHLPYVRLVEFCRNKYDQGTKTF